MSLASEIVGILGAENGSLVDALVKARILASRLGNAQLAQWCKHELSGYPEDVEVPPYRQISLVLNGTVSNGVYRYKNHPLPTFHLPDEQRDHLTKSKVREGVTAIQSWVGKPVAVQFPVDLGYLFADAIDATYVVEKLQGVPSLGAHDQIVVEVRSRLLEFALEVQDTLPPDDSIEAPISGELRDRVSSILNGAIFGDNTLIQIGDNNVAKVKNGVQPGDLVSLINQLRESGLGADDTDALGAAIAADGEEPGKLKMLGKNVRDWMASMMGKAAQGLLHVGVTAAASILTAALSSFYGFPVV